MGISAIIGIVTDLFGKIVGPLLAQWERWRAERTARNLGRSEQKAADLEAGLKEARDANKARGSVGGSNADVDSMLRPPGARSRD